MCSHTWVDLEHVGTKRMFVFRCENCQAVICLVFRSEPVIEVHVLQKGSPEVAQEDVRHFVDCLLRQVRQRSRLHRQAVGRRRHVQLVS